MSRVNDIKSFEVIGYSGNVLDEFIPADVFKRNVMWLGFKARGVILPEYTRFKRAALRKEDMKVVSRDWWMIFDYCGKRYKIEAAKGSCYDGASVPLIFVLWGVSKFNSKVVIPSLVHDALFALTLLPFEDANNVFSGLLKFTGTKSFARLRYMMGVRSPIGRILYRKAKPDKHWLKEFITFTEYK